MPELEGIFEEARRELAGLERKIQSIQAFEEAVAKQTELFDVEDRTKVQHALHGLQERYGNMVQDYKDAEELCGRSVTELEVKMAARLQLLEQLELSSGAVSAEPHLMEYFTRKQAVYVAGMQEVKKRLCAKIREKLGRARAI